MSDKPAAMSPLKAVVVAVAAVLIVVFAIAAQRQVAATGTADAAPAVTTEGAAPEATGTADAEQEAYRRWLLTELPRREEGDPLARGRVDATIVMTEWGDYRCPYCSVFAEETLPELQGYVDDGTLRIEFRDLALFGDDSVYAAVAARAAGEQGSYFEFQSALFSALPNDGHPDVTEELVTSIAAGLGLDAERFVADLADPALEEAVLADTQEAQALGLTSIPSFVVGGSYFTGAQTLDFFRQAIEEQVRQPS